MGCKHITSTERESILILLTQKQSIRAIARALDRSPSTISRELSRNTNGEAYSPSQAEQLYRKRRKACRPKRKLDNHTLRSHICLRLQEGWSPEQIIGREQFAVSVNTIYRAVKSRLLTHEAKKSLRRKGRPYRRQDDIDRRGHIKDALSIDLPHPLFWTGKLQETGNWILFSARQELVGLSQL